MDIENKIKYSTWGYIGVKVVHLVIQSVFITFMAYEYDGNGRSHFLSTATVDLLIIFCSAAWLLFSLKKVGYNYFKMEIITFLILLGVFSYSTTYGSIKYNTEQEHDDFNNRNIRSQNLETRTDPTYIINESTLESTYIDFTTKALYMKKEAELNTDINETLTEKPSYDFESSSAFSKKTTIEHVTMSTSLAPNPSIIPKKFVCRYIFTCVVLPSLSILIFQTLVIVVGYFYRKLINGNIDNIIPPVGFHPTDDGEGVVNIGFQEYDNNPQNNLENGTPAHENELLQNDLEDGPPADLIQG